MLLQVNIWMCFTIHCDVFQINYLGNIPGSGTIAITFKRHCTCTKHICNNLVLPREIDILLEKLEWYKEHLRTWINFMIMMKNQLIIKTIFYFPVSPATKLHQRKTIIGMREPIIRETIREGKRDTNCIITCFQWIDE